LQAAAPDRESTAPEPPFWRWARQAYVIATALREWSFCRFGDSVRVIKIRDGSYGSPTTRSLETAVHGLAAAGRISCALLASQVLVRQSPGA